MIFIRICLAVSVALMAWLPVLAQADEGAETYERRTRQQKIGIRHIPSDLNDAMKSLDDLTSESSRESYAAQSEDFVIERLFFSFGRWIAINWGLYDGSRFSVYLRNVGVDRPDGQKEFIMRAYHRYLNNEPLDVGELVGRYKLQKAQLDSTRRTQATVLDSYVRPAKRPAVDTVR